MPATLRDIADRLGLSTALVSRVVNDKPGVWASAATRQRVLEVARELNYRPSASARALVTGRTMQLAISTADAAWQTGGRERLGEVVGFIQSAALKKYRVLVLPSPERRADAHEFESLIRSNACDGFCVYVEQADEALYDLLKTSGVPFVVVGNPGDSTLPRVDTDNYHYTALSVGWLFQQGHRRIGFAYPGRSDAPYMGELRRGHAETMTALGLPVEDPWGLDRRRSIEERVSLLTSPGAPTALIILGVTDGMRWRMAASAAGLRIPEDLVLLIHTDGAELHYTQPGDAYHVHNPVRVGECAGELLIDWIVSGVRPANPVLVPTAGPRWFEGTEPGAPAIGPPRVEPCQTSGAQGRQAPDKGD